MLVKLYIKIEISPNLNQILLIPKNIYRIKNPSSTWRKDRSTLGT
ncbi:hypothetical protein GT901_21655 [Vibrio parahaemolyticus]|nr:hypothetical protein [Vibrio parahaemolyticus]EGR2990969.1 hypothetical protein [Vibrio parahaemolyticus]EGR3243107.1 hypothetical protein [Vibrio parahaemolyticus]TOH40029.1 hypothetical protein CGI82_12325 [Vibrio parahaemolyticus]TOK32283.1 hypothetical protein CGI19_21845 [Vibrio parahaemolyticus]